MGNFETIPINMAIDHYRGKTEGCSGTHGNALRNTNETLSAKDLWTKWKHPHTNITNYK